MVPTAALAPPSHSSLLSLRRPSSSKPYLSFSSSSKPFLSFSYPRHRGFLAPPSSLAAVADSQSAAPTPIAREVKFEEELGGGGGGGGGGSGGDGEGFACGSERSGGGGEGDSCEKREKSGMSMSQKLTLAFAALVGVCRKLSSLTTSLNFYTALLAYAVSDRSHNSSGLEHDKAKQANTELSTNTMNFKREEFVPSRRRCLACLCASLALINVSGSSIWTPNGNALGMMDQSLGKGNVVCRNCGGSGAIICTQVQRQRSRWTTGARAQQHRDLEGLAEVTCVEAQVNGKLSTESGRKMFMSLQSVQIVTVVESWSAQFV